MDERTLIYLKHILENIEKIQNFSGGINKNDLSSDELKQYAIVRAIEIIGEAAKNIPEAFKKEHPQISWKEIIGTRDIITHKYFGVDLDVIWDIIKTDLPELRKNINKIIKNA